MAVLSGATASGRVFSSGILTTTSNTVIYTAKGYTTNVVSDSGATSGTSGSGPATAYIKEIVLCNTIASPVTVTIETQTGVLLSGVTINGNDTKVLSGLNTMISAGQTLQAWCNTATAVYCTVSGVEIQ